MAAYDFTGLYRFGSSKPLADEAEPRAEAPEDATSDGETEGGAVS